MSLLRNVSFTYKKYHFTEPFKFFKQTGFSLPFGYTIGPTYAGAGTDHAPWIRTVNFKKSGLQLRIGLDGELHINESFADNLSPGVYTTRVKVRSYVRKTLRAPITQYDYYFNVTVVIIDTIPLSVSPTVISLTYTPPGTNLQTQNITINSENNWTITSTESWVVLGKTSGFGNDFVSVTADPSGLSAGAYNANLVVNDGVHSRTVQVVFLVSGSVASSDFLRVNPTAAAFLSLSGEIPSQTKNIRIESSSNYSTRFVNNLFTIDSTEDLNGIDQLTIKPNQQPFVNGVYQDTLEIFTTLTTVQVFLTLTVVDTQIQTIENGGLYYVEDRDKVSLVSTSSNTEGLFTFVATLENSNENYYHEVPFYRGISETLVGQEIRSLLPSVNPPIVIDAGITKMFNPANLALTIAEKEIFSSTAVTHSNFINLLFLNGSTPEKDNFLSKIPSSIHTTVNGVIMLSFYSSSAPTDIAINGDVTTNISISSTASSGVYTAIIRLNSLGVIVGDIITIEVNDVIINVSIIDTELDETLLLFENEWQTYESILLTGIRKITRLKGWNSTTVNNNGKRHTKIIEARSPRQFEIGIGKVYSLEQLNWISEYFNSKRFFLEYDGQRIEVEPMSSKFPIYETNKTFYDEVLKFKEAIV